MADGGSRLRVGVALAGLAITGVAAASLFVVTYGDDASSGVRSSAERADDGISGEGARREARAAAERVVMDLIEPLPDGLTASGLAEVCPNGNEPTCEHRLTVKATDRKSGPDELKRHLIERGWFASSSGEVYEHRDGGWLTFESSSRNEVVLLIAGRS